jgi:hypothetical protein
MHFDKHTVPANDVHSVLTPVQDFSDPQYYFDTPTGYEAPYWTAQLARITGVGSGGDGVWDCALGSDPDGTGHTIVAGNQIGGGTNWSVAAWKSLNAGNIIQSTHAASADETVLILTYVAPTPGSSSFTILWRDTAGNPRTAAVAGTIDPWGMKECFFGWVHEYYMAATAIKLGTPSLGELVDTIGWCIPHIPPSGSLGVEP